MMEKTDDITALSAFRQAIVRWARWGLSNERQIHYEQRRPIDGFRQPGKLPLYTDCSGFVTLCYKWAGAPNPNGNVAPGSGYTGTLLAHGRVIPESQLLPGDLVVFGPGSGSHVVIMIGSGPSGMVASHGSESGPKSYSLATAKTYFARPVRPLRVPGLAGLAAEPEPGDVELDFTIDPDGTNPPMGHPDGY